MHIIHVDWMAEGAEKWGHGDEKEHSSVAECLGDVRLEQLDAVRQLGEKAFFVGVDAGS